MIQPKVVLITGAARRIGKAIAEHLHRHGMNIIIHYHTSGKEAELLANTLNGKRPNSAVLQQADLLDHQQLEPLVQAAQAHWQRLDALINNASLFHQSPLNKVDAAQWENLFNCNVKAPFFLAQAAIPYLKSSAGSIINITDYHAEFAMKNYSVYCMTKSALQMMTRSLAKELGSDSIRVNAIAPGLIAWPEAKENQLATQEKKTLLSKTALEKLGSPEEIAKAALFLLKDANYITGETLHITGGRNC